MRLQSTLAILCAVIVAVPMPALAWGAHGHVIINGAAIRALPDTMPAFLRSAAAHDEIALLGPEADRIKGAGAPLDDDDNPGHYLDAQDDFTVGGVVKLSALPKDRAAYDTALRSVNTDQYVQGYLPYQIADGWEHIVRDLADWRVDVVGATKAPTAEDRALFATLRGIHEAVVLRDVGYWGHFVADASQPLHVSVHFNGWNAAKYPNPNGFSDSRTIHARFETDLVRAVATEDLVVPRMAPAAAPGGPILTQVGAYLTASAAAAPDVYRLEAAGGIDARSPAAREFVLDRLAAGAAEMRDLLVEAWAASGDAKVGYPGVPVRDYESGKAALTRASAGLGD